MLYQIIRADTREQLASHLTLNEAARYVRQSPHRCYYTPIRPTAL